MPSAAFMPASQASKRLREFAVRITQLSNSELAEAFRWIQARDWIGQTGKQAAAEAAKVLAD